MPEYTNSLDPLLYTTDIQETMRFYVEKLGFRVTGSYPPGDNPTWCSLAAGDAVIMFSDLDARLAYLGLPPAADHDTGMTGELNLYPQDVDEAWEELKDSVEIVSEMRKHPWGMRDFRIRDPNGYVLILGGH